MKKTLYLTLLSVGVLLPDILSAQSVGFIGEDSTTGGFLWSSKYGRDGYVIIGDATNYPSYVNVNVRGESAWIWGCPSSRGLEQATVPGQQIAACWYSPMNEANGYFTIDIDFVDGQTHQVALFCLDYEPTNYQTIEIYDTSGTRLDLRAVSDFYDGKYWVWNIQGHVEIRIVNSKGVAAVVSGVFFDPPVSPNRAPVVEAGPNQTTVLLNPVTLNGSATDDGLPRGSTLNYAWYKVSSRPGTVTFDHPDAAQTTARFSAAGVYTLRLVVGDTLACGFDDMTVIVADPSEGSGARLSCWSFDTAAFTSDSGCLPSVVQEVACVPSYSSNALEVVSSGALLKYPVIAANGSENIHLSKGTIRFYYQPRWYSAGVYVSAVPDDYVPRDDSVLRLVEVGFPSGSGLKGGLYVTISASGRLITLETENASGIRTTHLTKVIRFGPDAYLTYPWHEIVVMYSPEATVLFVDGHGTQGSGINLDIPAAHPLLGFSVGSGVDGAYQCKGRMEQLETFNYPISALERYKMSHYNSQVLSATTSDEPIQIGLSWTGYRSTATPINRKLAGAADWSIQEADWPVLGYVDNQGLSMGSAYEYLVSFRYLYTGIRVAPIDGSVGRGRIILLVDQTKSNMLATALERFQSDLVGDGWTVVRYGVPRHDDVSWDVNPNNIRYIKSLIASQWKNDPDTTRAVFLIGHVSIPYSGYSSIDGHPDHLGAWPCDAFYGDMDDSLWTDNDSRTFNNPYFPACSNRPNDGKFDLDTLPSAMELAVGRVDFANLDGVDEDVLLKQYFDKNHRYRHKSLTFQDRVVVGAYFGGQDCDPFKPFIDDPRDEGAYRNALNLSTRLYGTTDCVLNDFFNESESFTVGVLSGNGNPTTIRGNYVRDHSIADVIDFQPKGFFYILKASWAADFNMKNNLVRGLLIPANSGLAAVATSKYQESIWSFEKLGMGIPIGLEVQRSINKGGADRYMTLMGDPTLRFQVTAPVSGLQAGPYGSYLLLSWDAASDPNTRYQVLRSVNGMNGPWITLANDWSSASLIDTSPPAGQKIYQVRSLGLVRTGSGSFINNGPGVFLTVD